MADIKHTGQQSTDTANGKLRFEEGNNRIVVWNGTKIQMIIGFLPDSSIGVAVAKEGQDVVEAFNS